MKKIYHPSSKKSLIVTNGAFKSIYEPQGWKALKEEESNALDKDLDNELDKDLDKDNEPDINELLETPVSQLSYEGLVMLANHMGIETRNKSKKILSEEVKAASSK